MINTLTRRTLSRQDVHELLAEGHVYLLEAPIQIEDKHQESPLIVVMINRQSPVHHLFLVDRQKTSGLAAVHQTHQRQYYVFEDRGSFDTYAQTVFQAVWATSFTMQTRPHRGQSPDTMTFCETHWGSIHLVRTSTHFECF